MALRAMDSETPHTVSAACWQGSLGTCAVSSVFRAWPSQTAPSQQVWSLQAVAIQARSSPRNQCTVTARAASTIRGAAAGLIT
eukprot:714755-Rhodomonas_salina.1